MAGDSVKNPIQTTRHSFHLLELVVESGGATLSTLDSRADLSRGAIYNHLATLRDIGVVVKRNQKYYPSLRIYKTAEAARRSLPGTEAARKHLWNLADSTGELGAIAVKENDIAIVGDLSVGQLVDNLWVSLGEELPLHSTAAGKIILAQESDTYIADHYDQADDSVATEALLEEIKTVRLQGLAFSRGEYRDDQYSVAAPVTDRNDDFVYAVTLIGPESRLSGKSLQQDVAGLVVNTANQIERSLL